MNHLINLASKYFTAWNTNSVDELTPLLSEDVSLTDWDIDVSGLDSVLGANEQIFETVSGIRAEVLSMATNSADGTVFAQLKVHISETESIDVVDVITFNRTLITSIKAYKG
mgnify:CR=1 FL=1